MANCFFSVVTLEPTVRGAGSPALPATGRVGFCSVEHFRGLSVGVFFGCFSCIHSCISFGLILVMWLLRFAYCLSGQGGIHKMSFFGLDQVNEDCGVSSSPTFPSSFYGFLFSVFVSDVRARVGFPSMTGRQVRSSRCHLTAFSPTADIGRDKHLCVSFHPRMMVASK